MCKSKYFITALLVLTVVCGFAQEKSQEESSKSNTAQNSERIPANCTQSYSIAELDINNVRARILVGDLWWDLDRPKYEIPKGSGKHSIGVGGLWIGGVDANGQIRVAAQTYRQSGVDFWTGPINTSTVSTEFSRCDVYDKHWKVRREEVREFRKKFADPSYNVPADIQSWPGNGDPLYNEAQFLAPFEDLNGDGIYDWRSGEYPRYNYNETESSNCDQYLYGDETIWWVFNDVGNVHTESKSPAPVGVEVRAQAFAYKTSDEINNCTFYKYEFINRSFETIRGTYIGHWAHSSIGNFQDDYVGCDVQRGLYYCYNGDDVDETIDGYGINPPALAFDFLGGPLADPNDGIDNNRNGVIDELGEDIHMTGFMQYTNVSSSPTNHPTDYPHYYTYMQSIWLDGQHLTYGGDGRDPNGMPCNYMYPGETDPDFANSWTEATAGNPPGNRRMVSSVGPFTFEPGEVQYLTLGVIWARGNDGTASGSVEAMKRADDKAQGLFDNCFKIIEGPAAPDLTINEEDQRLIFNLNNTAVIESYNEVDPTISTEFYIDTTFRFEGYQVYQLAHADVLLKHDEPQDPDEVRLVAQFDIQNGVGRLINYRTDVETCLTIPYLAVDGSEAGIQHSFELYEDRFATADPQLVNHKTYHYAVVSYAHNNYKDFDPQDPNKLDGQKRPYLQGRENVQSYSAIPHKNKSYASHSHLGDIHVVPNPYYAFSEYEASAQENIIKIINLPPTCEIRIFTSDGNFVKQINRKEGANNDYGVAAEYATSVDWDLKNFNGIPIGSGLYLIHIKAAGIGERVLKWYGVIRAADIDSY